MSIIVEQRKKHKNVTFKPGCFYRFAYRAYANDLTPIAIFINAVKGFNPETGHQHRYIQAINFNYIPVKVRKRFLNDWIKSYNENGNLIFTWKRIVKRYPYIKFAIRRYFYTPTYYISDIEEVPEEVIRDVVEKNLYKDFSKRVQMALASKLKNSKKPRTKRKQ